MTQHEHAEPLDPARLAERLRPKLDELAGERQQLRRTALQWLIIIGSIAAVLVVAGLVSLVTGSGEAAAMIGLLPVLGGSVLCLVLGVRYQARWRNRVGTVLVPEVGAALDDGVEYQAQAHGSVVDPFRALELVGPWRRGEIDHLLKGEYQGRGFEMVHASLRSGGGGKNKNQTQVFNGLLFRIQTSSNVDPGLSIGSNKSLLARTFGKRAVSTGNETFDKLFRVSVEDSSEMSTEQLNQVFTPDWQQAVLALNELLGTLKTGEPRLRAGLKYDAFYLAVTLDHPDVSGFLKSQRHRAFPRVGNLLASEYRVEDDLESVVADIGIIGRVIEKLPDGGGTG